MTDDSLAPADAGTDKQPVFGRKILHNFTVFRLQPFGGYPGGMVEHFNKARALKGKDTELGEKLLLTNAQTECATGQVVGFSGRVPFNNGVVTRGSAHIKTS